MTITSTLHQEGAALLADLAQANRSFAKLYPGDRPDRQPVHTVYGGAHLFRAETPRRLGELAQRAMATYAPDAATFAEALNLPASVSDKVYQRVCDKLATEAVEDFRIDFEDGFGARPDAEEDATAVQAAQETARGFKEGTLSPFIGIRIKSMSEELTARSVRTLDIYVSTLVEACGGVLPPGFVVTLPKITVPEQVSALVGLFEILEARLGLAPGSLRMEMMIEVTQTLFDAEGRFSLPRLLVAAQGRCDGAHFGTYDYTASCSITAAHQLMRHPSCDMARGLMRIGFGGTGVFLSDGATNIMPVPPHRATADTPLTATQVVENMRVVHGAWKHAYDDTRHSLLNGFYQGWDLHPAQLPVRYAACYTFFLEGFDQAAERLRNFIDKAAQATLVGDVFDDAATGQGLLNYFVRALNCGAVSLEEVASTGLTLEEIQLRSFGKILEARRARMAG